MALTALGASSILLGLTLPPTCYGWEQAGVLHCQEAQFRRAGPADDDGSGYGDSTPDDVILAFCPTTKA